MKNLKLYFVSLGLVYTILFTLKKLGIYFPIVSDYLADLICVPITVMAIHLIMQKWMNRNFETGLTHILVTALYFSIVFEWLVPDFSTNYTSDSMDVICYFAGGLIFYFIAYRDKLFLKRVKPV